MAIRIAKLAEPAAQTPREVWRASITAWLYENDALREALRPDHPLFVFDIRHVSDRLTFCASLRHQPEVSAVGCATLFDLEGPSPDLVDERRFKTDFRAVIRALLFWTDAADASRDDIRLLMPETGALEWQAITQYIERALAHLPFAVSLTQDDGALRLTLYPTAMIDAEPARLNFDKHQLQITYGPEVGRIGLLRANEALKDALLIQISRLFLALLTPAQAKQREEEQKAIAEQMQTLPRAAESPEKPRGHVAGLLEQMKIS